MNIVELGKFYPPERGGIETLLHSFCTGFTRLGATVDCIVANRAPASIHETIDGVRVHRLASLGEAFSTSMCPTYPMSTRRRGIDIIHAHTPNPLADAAILAAPRTTPVVLTWHSDIVRQKSVLRLYRPLLNAVLRRANRIVVATPHHIDYSEWLPPWRSKTLVIPFGLRLERFAPSPARAAAAERLRHQAGGRTILLNVGRLVGYKGQKFAIEALTRTPAVLWLAGTGPLETSLRQLAAELGVADRVVFWGNVSDEDLPTLFHACDLFVFPSISPNEAFGLVQVEAMACGKPVIACNLRSGVPYVCLDGVTGLIVPPGNPEELSAAIRRLTADAALRQRLGAAAQKRAFEEFAEPVMLARYWKLMTEMTGRISA